MPMSGKIREYDERSLQGKIEEDGGGDMYTFKQQNEDFRVGADVEFEPMPGNKATDVHLV